MEVHSLVSRLSRRSVTWERTYHRLFALSEIEESERLRWIYYTVVAGFVLAFQGWLGSPVGTVNQKQDLRFACPEYFQSCHRWFVLATEPLGYGYNVLFCALFVFLASSLYFAIRRRWAPAHLLLLPPFAVKVGLGLFLTANRSIPFETYHLVPALVFLFFRRRMSTLRVVFVVLYVLAGLVKLDEGWIAGTYFSSLKLGLPLFPRTLIPLATNLVVVMEVAGAWCLFSERPGWRRIALGYFCVFHIYSFLLVGFRYPIHCLPLLLALFGGTVRPGPRPSLAAAGLVFVLAVCNLRPFFIAGDHKKTFEGTSLAMNMFDANRQSRSLERHHLTDGRVLERSDGSANSFDRITPYSLWYRTQLRCRQLGVERIEWTLDLSTNGSPFVRMVDVTDACQIAYRQDRHNDWIRADGPVIGYPDYNYYMGSGAARALPIVYPEPRIERSRLERFLIEQAQAARLLYWILALAAPAALIRRRRLGPVARS